MLNQKGAVADEKRRGRRDDRALVPVGMRWSRSVSQNEKKDRNVGQKFGRDGQDRDPLVNAGRHRRAPRTRRGGRRTRVFGRSLAARRGFITERGGCRSVRRVSAGRARAARLRRGRNVRGSRWCGSRAFRGARSELERDELAQARARRHDRLEGDQERHDDSDYRTPLAASAKPKPTVLYLRVLRTSIPSNSVSGLRIERRDSRFGPPSGGSRRCWRCRTGRVEGSRCGVVVYAHLLELLELRPGTPIESGGVGRVGDPNPPLLY